MSDAKVNDTRHNTLEPKPFRPTHSQPQDGGERWNPADEPTRLERIIASQFRRGMAVPLTPVEQQKLLQMNIEQRCDYVAKVLVYTARNIEKHIALTDPK